MPISRSILACLPIAAAAGLASAQVRPPVAKPPIEATPVVACASLANLRLVLRKANDDPAAAVSVASDTKADLNCTVLDRAAVTGITDHVALNGRAYDCVGILNSGICHWAVAGLVSPPATPAAPPRGAAAPAKPRR